MQQPVQYLVAQRAGIWSVMCNTVKRGPYITRQAAVDSALAMAKADFSEARTAIIMLEVDGKLNVIYDSTQLLQ